MKKSVILNIARAELKLIFTTPVAWIMLMVFTVLCGIFFTDVYGMYGIVKYFGQGFTVG